MPIPRFYYRPPVLKQRIILRVPGQGGATDALGRPIDPPDVDTPTWAHIRDGRRIQQASDLVLVEKSRTVVTIRERVVPINAKVVIDGEVYSIIGHPLRRGGIGNGRKARYIELDCEAV